MQSPRLAFIGIVLTAIVGLVVFGAAGRIDLPFVWVCLGLQASFWLTAAFVLPAELVRERMQPGKEGRVRDWHRTMALPLMVGSWVIVGLDLGRFHWSDTVPVAIRIAGLIGYAISLAGTLWAMRVNRFYSSIIRIQRDRGHHPITAGPYRVVRHPGYAMTIAACVTGGLALGSWIGLLPMLGMAAPFVRRAINEDRMLKTELEAYEEYARSVRWRLMPGVW